MNVAVEVRPGTAADLHALDPFADGPLSAPVLWVCEVTAPALVLGSRQSTEVVDVEASAAAGLEVTRRRSGGGAVLLRPGAVCWIDAVVPHGVAPDDVRGSMVWMGEIWSDALVELGADRDAITVHRGDMVCTPWSGLVCFAGVGPGEVLVGGRKLVGLSQRRTRHGIRVQCQLHRSVLLGEMPALFAVTVPTDDLAEPATVADVLAPPSPTDLAMARALASVVERRTTPV